MTDALEDLKARVSPYINQASEYLVEGLAVVSTAGFLFTVYGCRGSKVHPGISAGFALIGFIASTALKHVTSEDENGVKVSFPHMYSMSALGGFASPLLKQIPPIAKVLRVLSKYKFIKIISSPLPWFQLGFMTSQTFWSLNAYLTKEENKSTDEEEKPLNVSGPRGFEHKKGNSDLEKMNLQPIPSQTTFTDASNASTSAVTSNHLRTTSAPSAFSRDQLNSVRAMDFGSALSMSVNSRASSSDFSSSSSSSSSSISSDERVAKEQEIPEPSSSRRVTKESEVDSALENAEAWLKGQYQKSSSGSSSSRINLQDRGLDLSELNRDSVEAMPSFAPASSLADSNSAIVQESEEQSDHSDSVSEEVQKLDHEFASHVGPSQEESEDAAGSSSTDTEEETEHSDTVSLGSEHVDDAEVPAGQPDILTNI